MTIVLMVVVPLLVAWAIRLAVMQWRPWEALESAPRRVALQPAIASDTVLYDRGCALAYRLAHDGRISQARLVAAALRLRGMDGVADSPFLVYRTEVLALLREHGVSTSPDPQL